MYRGLLGLVHLISIHPPRVGRDGRLSMGCTKHDLFQSTLPVWGGTCTRCYKNRVSPDFNPPSPCGEGPPNQDLDVPFFVISIHPPRVGRDRNCWGACTTSRNFNPPSPCGEGLAHNSNFDAKFVISIHPPRVGRDRVAWSRKYKESISIHPPRVGRDALLSISRSIWDLFQSTLPVWGGTQVLHALF